MPRVTQLCADLAERFRFEETKVHNYSRVLREAGMVTTGARGINAPDATPLDAARLLIAMMLRTKADDTLAGVKLFGGFVALDEGAAIGGRTVTTFEDALEALIEYCGIADAGTADGEARYSDFSFEAAIVRDLAIANVRLAKLDDEGEESEVRSFRFAHPDIAAADDANLTVPERLAKDWRHYRSGFHEIPTLMKGDLLNIGQVIAGRIAPGEEIN